ncbi:MAG: DUF6788 family protein [Candidatus Thorarchaeota archaeon]
MASLVAKLQRCGKKNCQCFRKGKLHGPYYWLVIYKGVHQRRKKYHWKYCGASRAAVLDALPHLVDLPDFEYRGLLSALDKKVRKIRSQAMRDPEGKKTYQAKVDLQSD